jgi:hypothetical protein
VRSKREAHKAEALALITPFNINDPALQRDAAVPMLG